MGFFKSLVRLIPALGAAAVGTFFGGPLGGISAAAGTNVLVNSKKRVLKNALQGAGVGALYTAAAPGIAQKFGAVPGSFGSQAAGLEHASLMSQLGVGAAPSIGGGLGLYGNMGTTGLLQSPAAGMMGPPRPDTGLFGSALGGLFQNGGLSPYGVGGLALLSNLSNQKAGMANERAAEAEGEGSYEGERQRGESAGHNPGYPYEPYMMSYGNRRSKYSSMDYDPLPVPQVSLIGSGREHSPTRKRSYSRPITYKTGGYAHGGKPIEAGYIPSGYVQNYGSGGQEDDIYAYIPEGSYVMNATDVSLLGDGVSDNGALKLDEFQREKLASRHKNLMQEQRNKLSGRVKPVNNRASNLEVLKKNDAKEFSDVQKKNMNHGGIYNLDDGHAKNVNYLLNEGGATAKKHSRKMLRVRLANGEYVLEPEVVEESGKGDEDRGVKIINQARKKLRTQKGVEKILPPRAKRFTDYLGDRQ